ncbi:MAG: hypothetical protein SGI92_24350, partial [Bryobacteraceae bacterium]|nr:hypothetical protein [Bryobacteraceae bacterium]
MLPSSTDLLRSNVAGKYFLQKVVGGSNDDALFLADAPDGSPVHVRLAPEGSPAATSWPAVVEKSARLIHPHLLRYVEAGDCRLDTQPWHYLVMEAVSDRVDEVLLERPLSAEETDAVLRAVLLALSHLHDNGFVHGAPTRAAVVAASDLIKLTGETISPLPADETNARRAISAELLELGETATELLTRARGQGAAATLPSPFAEFVRATAGTSACPHPTAMQLMDVLDGKELVSAPPVMA